jgi:hypothetical protein
MKISLYTIKRSNNIKWTKPLKNGLALGGNDMAWKNAIEAWLDQFEIKYAEDADEKIMIEAKKTDGIFYNDIQLKLEKNDVAKSLRIKVFCFSFIYPDNDTTVKRIAYYFESQENPFKFLLIESENDASLFALGAVWASWNKKLVKLAIDMPIAAQNDLQNALEYIKNEKLTHEEYRLQVLLHARPFYIFNSLELLLRTTTKH